MKTNISDVKVVAIQQLLWSYHPLCPSWQVVDFNDTSEIVKADVYVQTNIKESKKQKKLGHIYQYIIDSGKPWIVAESAVFRNNMPTPPNPKSYHRYGWFSYFRDEGDYNNRNCPDDRWKQIQTDQNIRIKPWKTKGDYVLLILQRPGDSSLKNLMQKYGDYETFVHDTLENIKNNTDKKIVIRLHPLRRDRQIQVLKRMNLQNISISENTQGNALLSGGSGLYRDFSNASAVVGFNSNALTESICEGIPTFSLCPSSMAWECSNTDLENLENPELFDRSQWLANLGYCQWREDEVLENKPWEHLFSAYERIKRVT